MSLTVRLSILIETTNLQEQEALSLKNIKIPGKVPYNAFGLAGVSASAFR
jgi:hypothetical protein